MAGMSGATVEERLEGSLQRYWLDRVAQHTHDSYAGIPLSKFPEDLRVYEHLLWADQPNTVIELGSQYGASALWFRDRLRTLAGYGLIADYRVIAVDVQTDAARTSLERADRHWEEEHLTTHRRRLRRGPPPPCRRAPTRRCALLRRRGLRSCLRHDVRRPRRLRTLCLARRVLGRRGRLRRRRADAPRRRLASVACCPPSPTGSPVPPVATSPSVATSSCTA